MYCWSCYCWNQTGILSDSPRVVASTPLTLQEFQTQTLNCSADSNPAPRDSNFKWTNQNGFVNASLPQLRIVQATKHDTGPYMCHVSVRSEEYGLLNGSATTRVTVQCKCMLFATTFLNSCTTISLF